MPMTTRTLRDDITYWKNIGDSPLGDGSFVFDPPILIKGRWEGEMTVDNTGSVRSVTSDAKVFVDRDVFVQDYLAKGDQTDVDDPVEVGGQQILRTSVTHDIRNIEVTRCAFL